MPGSLSQPAARANCIKLGGDLVRYSSATKQLMVESYFAGRNSLTSGSYWIGVSRSSALGGYRWGPAPFEARRARLLSLARLQAASPSPNPIHTHTHNRNPYPPAGSWTAAR